MDQQCGTFSLATLPPCATVSAQGELDVATSPQLSSLLTEAVSGGCRFFLLDLGGVTFCDASTIGVIVRLGDHLRETGGQVEIVGASRKVRRVFHLVGLDDLLTRAGPEQPGPSALPRGEGARSRPGRRATRARSS